MVYAAGVHRRETEEASMGDVELEHVLMHRALCRAGDWDSICLFHFHLPLSINEKTMP